MGRVAPPSMAAGGFLTQAGGDPDGKPLPAGESGVSPELQQREGVAVQR
jgi:hypothetical protein